eukprot:403334265
MCSLGFLGVYVAVYSAQNAQSQIYDIDGYKNLGYVSNAVAYVGQGVGSIFCVYVMQRVGDIKAMAYSALLSLPFIISLLLPALNNHGQNENFLFSYTFVTMITVFTSFLNGFGGGINQPASGKFISDCATERTKGFFFAYFWAFYMGSQVIGNLIASLALGYLEQYYYVLIMFVTCFLSILILFKLKSPVIHRFQPLQQQSDNQQINVAINSNEDERDSIVQLITQDQNHPQVQQQLEITPLKEVVKSLWNLFVQKRFRLFIPQLLWTGISIAFFSGNLVELMSLTIQGGEQDKFKQSMAAMILFGVGEIFGCFFIGLIVDKFGSKIASLCLIVIMIMMTVTTLVYCLLWEFGWLAFLMCFLWGFQDSSVNTHSQEILGFEFDNNYEPYSVYNILQCSACAIFQIIEIAVITQKDYIIFTIFTGCFGVFCCSTMLFFDFRESKSHKEHHNSDESSHDDKNKMSPKHQKQEDSDESIESLID